MSVANFVIKRARAASGAVAAFLVLAGSVFAQTAVPADVVQMGRFEVTGSLIKRLDAETSLPVQILDHEDIQRTGVSTVEQLLKTVSATETLGATQVANTGAGGGQGGGGSVSLLSLRGLGSARTLVLINGRRAAAAGGSSAVDISSLPLASIERVEVLKDGASAIYGSDAVAGVVNFILRRDFSGTEFTTTLGAPTRSGGGTEEKFSIFTGFGDFDRDRYSVTLTAGYSWIKPIFGSSRLFARNIDVPSQLDKTSVTAFPANVRLNNGTLASPNYPDCGPYSLVSALSPGLCRYDNAPFIALQPDTRLANIGATARFKLANSVEVYAEPYFSRNKTRNTEQHVLINGAALPAGNPYIADLSNLLNTNYSQFPQLKSLIGSAWALLPPTSPYYPTAFASANGLTGQPLVLLFRSVPTGVRKTLDVEDNTRIVAGIRGTAKGWDFDTGILYGENKIADSLTQGWALTEQYLNLIDSGVINPFGPTTDPNALQAAINSNFNGLFTTTRTSLAGVDAKGSRELFQMAAGAVNLALGGEFRREKLDIIPSDANRNFLVSGFGAPGVPISAKRKVGSTYAEMTLPVVKGMEIDAAVRYDYYERVGHTVNPKGSIRWQPMAAVLVRASLGTGFRAPTLTDLFSPQARGITTNGSRDLVRCPIGTSGLLDCSTQFVTNGGGNPNLQPEKSKSSTVGLVLEPIKNYSIGIDYFRIEIKNIIRTGLSTATILADPVTYASYIHRGPPDGNSSGVGSIIGIDQLLTNLGRANVDGFDVDLKARLPVVRANTFTVRLNGTYLMRYDQQNLDGTFGSAVNRPSAIGIGVALRWRHTAGITWQHGGWNVDVAQNYQVGYPDLRTSLQAATVTPRRVAPYETYDMQIAYSGIKSTRLTLGVKNLLDRDPPYTNYGAGFVGGYDLSYTDVRGRFVYLSAQYSWK